MRPRAAPEEHDRPSGKGELDPGAESARPIDWAGNYAKLAQGASSGTLEADDLERLADAAFVVGRLDACIDAFQRSFLRRSEAGDRRGAVRCAFWLCFHHFNNRDFGQGSGWLARANHLIDGEPDETAERAWLMLPLAFQQTVVVGDYEAGQLIAGRAAELGRRFGETELVLLALNIQGRALLRDGKVASGLAVLDEAMSHVVAGAVSATVAGIVYCTLLDGCMEVAELRRAHEWTQAFTRWCDRQSGMVNFTGECLVHRSTISQMHGDWVQALEEAQQACERFAGAADHYGLGMGLYRLGELYRVRGDLDAAETAYRTSGEHGRDPQPGLALLRLAQGKVGVATSALQRASDEARDRPTRASLLPAVAQAALAAADLAVARTAAEELDAIAETYGTPALRAEANRVLGTVLLAEGDARAALKHLRDAWKAWRGLEMPHDEARTRVLIAQACRALGDDESCDFELAAARQVLERLGAAPDLARLELITGSRSDAARHGLSERELEVLVLVAAGMTNQQIAGELVLAVRTVDRHVSNILAKLGVPSRAAATAYAVKHGLA